MGKIISRANVLYTQYYIDIDVITS